jgi:UDP-N-acetylmuramoyl-tripeptide--D-alanyl-D-alanine ligase
LKYIAEAAGGALTRGGANALARRVHTDSRSVQAGDLFVALAGERFDAHAFLPEVAARGAVAAIVARGRGVDAPELGLIEVGDTRRALGRLAARYREDFDLPVIAVGGSNGKTTAKELIASVLARRLATLKSAASFNNDIGVPRTLLELETGHQAAVIELGSNHPGELGPLVQMVQPRFGVVTSLGREHLEFFGDIYGVAEEEGWLAELLPADGLLLVHGDSPQISRVVERAACPVMRLGFGRSCEWQVQDVQVKTAGTIFRVSSPRDEFDGEYRVRMPGRHHAVNALFAVALGAELGLSREEVRRGLETCEPAAMRSNLFEARGVTILDDAYNANADSMSAALRTLSDLPCAGRRVAVLGAMAELGEQSPFAHEEVGRVAVEAGVDRLFVVGAEAQPIADAAAAAGLEGVDHFVSVEACAPAVSGWVRPGDVVLVKASRAARLERIVERLKVGT